MDGFGPAKDFCKDPGGLFGDACSWNLFCCILETGCGKSKVSAAHGIASGRVPVQIA